MFGSLGAGYHAIMRSIKHVTEEIPPQMMPRLVESLSQLDLEIDPECALKISKKWNSWLTRLVIFMTHEWLVSCKNMLLRL